MNHSHNNLVDEYVEFARFQRIQHVKAIKSSFKRIIDSRLLDGTYTSEEVEEILQELCECISGDVESEIINISHMNILLLKQLLEQAENLGFTLRGSISEMQNGDLLEQMRAEEMSNISGNRPNSKTVHSGEQMVETGISDHSKVDKLHDPELTHENLKKILCKKNEVIKDLRERLLRYENINE